MINNSETSSPRDRALDVFERRNRAFRVLYDTVLEVEGVRESVVYEILCRKLCLLTDAVGASLAAYSPENRQLEVLAVETHDSAPAPIGRFGHVGQLQPDVEKRCLEKRIMHCDSDLARALVGVGDPAFSSDQEPAFYRLAIAREKEVIAVAVIVLGAGQRLQMKDMVDTYLGLAGMILQRLNGVRALRESEEKLEGIVASITDLMVMVDKTSTIVWANDVAERSFPSGLVGRRCFEALRHRDRPCEKCHGRATFLDGQTREYESSLVCEDGSSIDTWSTVNVAARDEEGNPSLVVEIMRDVTERNQMEEQVRRSQKMQAVGHLAGGIAHDFNNQLAGIMNCASLLNDNVKDPRLRRYTERIIESVRKSSDLTAQLLGFASQGKYQAASVNIHSVVEDVIAQLRRKIFKRITITSSLDAGRSVTTGDPIQLTNALMELALNGVDAMDDGGWLTITTSQATLGSEDNVAGATGLSPGDYIRVQVFDTGRGMDDATLSAALEPFFTTKGQGEGTGMGLPSVYGVIKGHSGDVSIESAPGRGTAVTILLPLAVQAGDAPEEPVDTSIEEPDDDQLACVLLVDDEDVVREISAEALMDHGCDVLTAVDGLEAIEVFRKNADRLDIVFLDMLMPRMNGPDAFYAMHEINPDVKIVLCSGFSLDRDAQELLNGGAFAFMRKPFLPDAMIEQIEAVRRA